MVGPARVAFLLPNLAGGGAERVITTLIRHLDTSRIKASLILLNGRDNTFRALVPEHVEVTDLQKPRLRQAMPALLGLIRRTRPDVVVSTIDHLNVGAGLLRPFWPSQSKLVIRATDFLSLDSRRFRWLMGASFRNADAIIYQSEAMKRAFSERLGLGHLSHRAIPNPVDIAEVRRKAAEPTEIPMDPHRINLVSIGRLAPAKGFDILLDAIGRLERRDLAFHILGAGAEADSLNRQSEALGLVDRVRFWGFQSNPYAVLARADGLVLSSRFEGFPNVVLEALACGKPVLSTPVPGIEDALAGVPGCVVTAGFSADALAQALEVFLERGRTEVPQVNVAGYAAERIARTYEDFLLSVEAGRGR